MLPKDQLSGIIPVSKIILNNLRYIGTIIWLVDLRCSFLAWAWLAKPKVNVAIPNNQPLPKYLRKKTSKSAKYHLPLRYKKDPLK